MSAFACRGSRPLFDLAFLEFDVLAGDRIVFLEHELLGLVPRVLLRDVVIAGARAAHELDLLRDGLCHFILDLRKVGRTYSPGPGSQDREVKTRPSAAPAAAYFLRRRARSSPLRHWDRSRA